MNLLELHISYLISRHDLVIVPGWGAFVAHYSPASIDMASGLIMPPSRQVGFNGSLTHNDALLASSVARSLSIGYDKAVEMVADAVSQMRAALAANGRVSVDPLGWFTSSDSGALLFTPQPTPIAAPAFHSLAPVPIKSVKAKAIEEAAIVAGRAQSRRMPRIVRIAARAAASVALLISLGVVLTTPIVVDNHEPAKASCAPAAKITPPKAASVTELLPSQSQASTLWIAIPSDGSAIADTTARTAHAKAIAEPKPAHSAYRRMLEDDPYCLIIASLPSLAEAEKFIAHAADSSLGILEQDGRFRIYAATGATTAQAREALTNGSLRRSYPGAWVCHR